MGLKFYDILVCIMSQLIESRESSLSRSRAQRENFRNYHMNLTDGPEGIILQKTWKRKKISMLLYDAR